MATRVRGIVDDIADRSPVRGQDVANAAGGVIDGLTLGHSTGFFEGFNKIPFMPDLNGRYDKSSGLFAAGSLLGTGLLTPFAWGQSTLVAAAVTGNTLFNAWSCYRSGDGRFLGEAFAGAAAGGWIGLGGGGPMSVAGFLFDQLFKFDLGPPAGLEFAGPAC